MIAQELGGKGRESCHAGSHGGWPKHLGGGVVVFKTCDFLRVNQPIRKAEAACLLLLKIISGPYQIKYPFVYA